MRGLANLDYGKKILITNSVKEEFKNIEIQERTRLNFKLSRDTQQSTKSVALGWGIIFVDFWFQRIVS